MNAPQEITTKFVPLCDLAEIRTGLAVGKIITNATVFLPYLRVANVQDGRIDLGEVKQIRVEVSAVDRYRLENGDVLLTEGGDIDKLGRGAVWKGQIDPCIHQNHVFAVRPNPLLLDSAYLAALASSDYGRKYFLGCAKRTTNLASINSSQLKAFPVIARAIGEQKKIAAILTAVDDKLDVIARQIEATQTLKRGLMQTLFSRGVGSQDAHGRWVPHTEFKDSELGKIPSRWSVRSLGSITQEIRERNSGSLDDALLCGVLKEQGLVPMRERVKGATTERCRVVGTDAFAYNPMRINIGSIARNLRNHPVMVSPDYVVFVTKAEELIPEYLDHFRHSETWQRFVGRSGDGGVRIRIYYADLARLRMKIPPVAEQAKIVEILDCISAKLNLLAAKHEKLQRSKRGLMQKLLTGQWRVQPDHAGTPPPVAEAA